MELVTLVLCLGLVAVAVVRMNWLRRSSGRGIDTVLRDRPGFRARETLVAADNSTAVALDAGPYQLALATREKDAVRVRVLPVKELVAVAVCEDGDPVLRTLRLSREGEVLLRSLGPAPLDALFTPAGGSATVATDVRRLEVRFVVSEPSSPVHVVPVLTGPTRRGSAAYHEAMVRAEHWHALATLLIRRADEQDSAFERDMPAPVARPAW